MTLALCALTMHVQCAICTWQLLLIAECQRLYLHLNCVAIVGATKVRTVKFISYQALHENFHLTCYTISPTLVTASHTRWAYMCTCKYFQDRWIIYRQHSIPYTAVNSTHSNHNIIFLSVLYMNIYIQDRITVPSHVLLASFPCPAQLFVA